MQLFIEKVHSGGGPEKVPFHRRKLKSKGVPLLFHFFDFFVDKTQVKKVTFRLGSTFGVGVRKVALFRLFGHSDKK